MGKVLDLSGADTSGGDFPALPAGGYETSITNAEWVETRGSETAKLPGGTPMLNVEFTCTEEEEHSGRKFWRSYVQAPAKVNGKKNENKAKTDGMLVRFIATALELDEEEVTSGEFSLDVEDLIGRKVKVIVGRELKQGRHEGDDGIGDPFRNEVKGVKAAGSSAATASKGLI